MLQESSNNAVSLSLSSATESSNYQMYINTFYIDNEGEQQSISLMADTGNITLIMPYYEKLDQTKYQVLKTGREPWGCPTIIVMGPISVPQTDGTLLTIENCIFQACTGPQDLTMATHHRPRKEMNSTSDGRTQNFGLAIGQPQNSGTMTALAYTGLRYMEIIMNSSNNSVINLMSNVPSGYSNFYNNIPGQWSALTPTSKQSNLGFTINGHQTRWPTCNNVSPNSTIALLDTGGGNTFLKDPNGCLNDIIPTLKSATCPNWAIEEGAKCYEVDMKVQLGPDGSNDTYVIDYQDNLLIIVPPDCRYTQWGSYSVGINLGGITMLTQVYLLQDMEDKRLAFKSRR